MRKSSVNGCFHRESRVDSQLDLTNALNLFLFFFFLNNAHMLTIFGAKKYASQKLSVFHLVLPRLEIF